MNTRKGAETFEYSQRPRSEHRKRGREIENLKPFSRPQPGDRRTDEADGQGVKEAKQHTKQDSNSKLKRHGSLNAIYFFLLQETLISACGYLM